MATQLGLYNAALNEIGEERLASLTDNTPARHVLDSVYDNVCADCLEAADWNHSIREIQAAADTGVTPNFGFTEVFDKPSDWVRTIALADNESYWPPLADHQYEDSVGFWSANTTPIYVRYVSNGTSYGLNLDIWPRSFTRFVELELARRIVKRLTQNEGDYERLVIDCRRAKRDAMSKDAMNEGMKFYRASSWNNARGGYSRRERGNPNSFTG